MLNLKTSHFLIIALFFFVQLHAQYNIIPEPASTLYAKTEFDLSKKINILSVTKLIDFEINYLKNLLQQKGFEVTINEKSNPKDLSISMVLDSKQAQKKFSYKLKTTNENFVLSATEPSGIFAGIQTINQMLPFFEANKKLTNCEISDAPTYDWRGLMLDVSRHFFTVNEVKQYIDLMARYKFSVFHWHLTDDHGWRIEIKSLPKLTEIGAWRVDRTGKFPTRDIPKLDERATYGGFYTQDQIKEIVAFAVQRHITIVPEIDVPGHSMALLAAYPELSTKKEPKFVSPGNKFSEWFGNGKFKMTIENTVNPVDEKVYEALDKIYTEVAALFPSEYLHVGGDEAYHGFWEADKACQDFMKANNMKTGDGLQSYFMKRVEKIISSKGKKMIGWDEILYGGLADKVAVMSWQSMKGGIEAAKTGHKVVMSPTEFCYFDYQQGDSSNEESIYAALSLKKVYDFNPFPEGVDPQYILGAQGNLWTEHVPTISHAFYMTYPRAFALSEVLWTGNSNKNWNRFLEKTEHHFKIFDQQEIDICKAVYDPNVKIYKKDNITMCELSCETPNSAIFYTLNNTFPNRKSTKYTEPFEIPNTKISLKASTFRDGKPLGRLINLSRSEIDSRIK